MRLQYMKTDFNKFAELIFYIHLVNKLRIFNSITILSHNVQIFRMK